MCPARPVRAARVSREAGLITEDTMVASMPRGEVHAGTDACTSTLATDLNAVYALRGAAAGWARAARARRVEFL